MIKHTEVMKLALEALSKSDDFLFDWHENESDNEADAYATARHLNEKAITALRKTLASEAKEQPAPATELREQEQLREENERLHVENRRLIDRIETIGVSVGVGGIATTTAQRTWVNATTWRGLTDEDIASLDLSAVTVKDAISDVRAVEAKLKEKNA